MRAMPKVDMQSGKKATPKVMVHFYWLLIGREHCDWFSRLCIEIDCETRKLCHAMKRG